MVFDTNITYDANVVRAPLVIAQIIDNETLNDVGTSGLIYVGGSTHLLLMVTLGTKTEAGTASVKFHIYPVDAVGTAIGAFDYATAELVAAGVVGVAVDETSTTPLGDYVAVVWTTANSLNATNYFAASSVKLIAK